MQRTVERGRQWRRDQAIKTVLTEGTAPALAHSAHRHNQQWLMARLKEPASGSGSLHGGRL